LDLDTLKRIRLVSKLWACEAGRHFANKVLIRQDPGRASKLEELAEFLNYIRFKYTLQLSLLDRPWKFIIEDGWEIDDSDMDSNTYLSEERKQRIEYQAQHNNKVFISAIFETVFTPPGVTFLTELRLEMRMSAEEDARVLVDLLTRAISLKRLALDLTNARRRAIKSLPLDTSLPRGLKTLAYRIIKV